MTDEEIERLAEELQQNTPAPGGLGTVGPYTTLTERSKEYWRVKVRRGERAPASKA